MNEESLDGWNLGVLTSQQCSLVFGRVVDQPFTRLGKPGFRWL